MEKNIRRLDVLVGLALLGCTACGVMGFIAALIALLRGDHIGAGICLVAAGLSFGLCGLILVKS